ncbi:MAG TPA: hypothetical protein VFF31_27545 [Blastocatellia bacterium]|nr:hypothetical protein [Blastocatellia bacterium]
MRPYRIVCYNANVSRRKNTVIRQTPAFEAADIQGRVNGVLASSVGTIFCAGTPTIAENGGTWRVPILYATPGFVVDEVGEALVDASTAEILSLTDIDLLHQHGRKLGKQHSAEIEAAFSRTRKG